MLQYRAAALAFVVPALACQSIQPADESRWIVDVTPALSVDWDSDIDGYDQHDVRAAIRLEDGRILIVDGGSAEIRWFDRDGAFRGRLGGDAVFHRIQEAVRGRGDTMVIRTMDPAIVRVDGRTGTVLDRVALPPALPADSYGLGGSLSPDGSLLLTSGVSRWRPGSPPPEGPWRDEVILARFDPAARVVDTLRAMPGPEHTGKLRPRFDCSIAIAPSMDWFVAAESCGDSILVTGYDGAPLGVRHSGLERNAVPQDVIEHAAAMRYPPDLPAEYPRFSRLLADRSGNLWVMAYPRLDAGSGWRSPAAFQGMAEGADWVVLDPAGRRIAQVRTPPGLHVLEIGDDYLIGVVREDVNVEAVRMYTLHRL